MEALVVKCDILKQSRYQLPMLIPPSHSVVVPKLIVVWASVCFRRIKIRKCFKTDIIPFQYSVMEALVLKCDILNLSRYLLQTIIPPNHSALVPKLIVVWASVCS